jgi:hypothetical protein
MIDLPVQFYHNEEYFPQAEDFRIARPVRNFSSVFFLQFSGTQLIFPGFLPAFQVFTLRARALRY